MLFYSWSYRLPNQTRTPFFWGLFGLEETEKPVTDVRLTRSPSLPLVSDLSLLSPPFYSCSAQKETDSKTPRFRCFSFALRAADYVAEFLASLRIGLLSYQSNSCVNVGRAFHILPSPS